MGLFKLFKTKPEEIEIEPATTGRVLKEISELNLSSQEREILLDLYQSIMSIDNQEDRLRFLSYLARLVIDLPLTQIDHPLDTGEYIAHSSQRLQSSRCKSLWSHDAGKQWYDIDDSDKTSHIFYRWIYTKIFRARKAPEFITKRILPYVNFPYTKNIKQSYLK